MKEFFEIGLTFYAEFEILNKKIESDHRRNAIIWHESKYYPRKKKKFVRKKIVSEEIIYKIYKSIWQ